MFDAMTESHFTLTPGQGHFGPVSSTLPRTSRCPHTRHTRRSQRPATCPLPQDAVPGDARWRRGESVSLKTAREAMHPAEIYKRNA